MTNNSTYRGVLRIILFCAVSLLAGCVNGFLGTGGGIFFMYALTGILKVDPQNALSTTICATVPISALALISYIQSGSVDFELMRVIWLPTAIGGLAGALLVDRLKPRWLTRIFAVLVIYSGLCMILR